MAHHLYSPRLLDPLGCNLESMEEYRDTAQSVPSWDLRRTFLRWDWRCGTWAEDSGGGLWLSSRRIEGCGQGWFWPWPPGWGPQGSLLCCEVAPRPPFHTVALSRSSAQPHSPTGVGSVSLKVDSLHKLLSVLLHGRFVWSPSLICLPIYISLGTWVSLLYFGIQSSTTLLLLWFKLFQLWPLGGAFSDDSCDLLTQHHSRFFKFRVFFF